MFITFKDLDMGIVSTKFVNNLFEFGYRKALPTDFWVHPEEDSIYLLNKINDDQWEMQIFFTHIRFKRKEDSKPSYMQLNHKDKSYRLHVLKALAFIPMKKEDKKHLGKNFKYHDLYKSKIIVNHKDGDRYNNDIKNLEWATYKENLEHAFINGLRTDNLFGCAYDVVMDKEIYFYSINQLGREIKIHADYISRYLKSPRFSLLANRYMVKKAEEKDYPHKLTYDDIWKPSLGGIMPIEVTNTKSKKILEFGSLAEVAKNLNFNLIKKALFKDKYSVKKIKEFELRPICDYERIMKIKKKHDVIKYESLRENRKIKDPLKVKVTLENGTIMIFKSRKKAAKYFSLSDAALKARLYKYEGMWKNIKFEYIGKSS